MLSFFKKTKNDPLRQKLKNLKCRQIHFTDDGYDKIVSDMDKDYKAMLNMVPVNYYAVLNSIVVDRHHV